MSRPAANRSVQTSGPAVSSPPSGRSPSACEPVWVTSYIRPPASTVTEPSRDAVTRSPSAEDSTRSERMLHPSLVPSNDSIHAEASSYARAHAMPSSASRYAPAGGGSRQLPITSPRSKLTADTVRPCAARMAWFIPVPAPSGKRTPATLATGPRPESATGDGLAERPPTRWNPVRYPPAYPTTRKSLSRASPAPAAPGSPSTTHAHVGRSSTAGRRSCSTNGGSSQRATAASSVTAIMATLVSFTLHDLEHHESGPHAEHCDLVAAVAVRVEHRGDLDRMGRHETDRPRLAVDGRHEDTVPPPRAAARARPRRTRDPRPATD